MTTTSAPTSPGAPGYQWSGRRARSAYAISFFDGVPQKVKDSITRAATAITSRSGVTFTTGVVSGGSGPAEGEIRVRVGSLCNSGPGEAGCAVNYWAGDRLLASDVSLTTTSVESTYLDSVTFHELGHSVGLDHVLATKPPQIMNPYVNASIQTYQAGDIAGLELVGAKKYLPGQALLFIPLGVQSGADDFKAPL